MNAFLMLKMECVEHAKWRNEARTWIEPQREYQPEEYSIMGGISQIVVSVGFFSIIPLFSFI